MSPDLHTNSPGHIWTTLYIYIYILTYIQHNGYASLENQNFMIFLSSYTQMMGKKTYVRTDSLPIFFN